MPLPPVVLSVAVLPYVTLEGVAITVSAACCARVYTRTSSSAMPKFWLGPSFDLNRRNVGPAATKLMIPVCQFMFAFDDGPANVNVWSAVPTVTTMDAGLLPSCGCDEYLNDTVYFVPLTVGTFCSIEPGPLPSRSIDCAPSADVQNLLMRSIELPLIVQFGIALEPAG